MTQEHPDLIGSERDVLVHYLGRMREAVIATTEGLTDDALRRPGVPSGTSLLGVVHHLTGVEQHWFRVVFLGEQLEPDMSMDPPADATAADVIAAYRAAGRRSDEIIRACPDLSTMSAIANPGEDDIDALRLITAHMLRETSRHAGQCDILRELVDGRTAD